jgi:hypothetical protein
MTLGFTDVNFDVSKGVTNDGNDANFLPSGTVIKVELDSSGDFTSLSDAVNYLTGKWSNGSVVIQLGNGTFDIDATINITGYNYNFHKLVIKGNGATNTTINSTLTNSNYIFLIKDRAYIEFLDIAFTKTDGTQSTSYSGIMFSNADGDIKNCSFQGLTNAVYARTGSKILLYGSTSFSNANIAINCDCSQIVGCWAATSSFTNITTAINVGTGGIINGYNWSQTYTNITNKTSQTVGTPTSNGWITGVTV